MFVTRGGFDYAQKTEYETFYVVTERVKRYRIRSIVICKSNSIVIGVACNFDLVRVCADDSENAPVRFLNAPSFKRFSSFQQTSDKSKFYGTVATFTDCCMFTTRHSTRNTTEQLLLCGCRIRAEEDLHVSSRFA